MPVKPIPEGYRSITPYLIVNNAAASIEFYKRAFGATERFRMAGPNGKVGHAELAIGDSVIMLADEFPEMNAKSPLSYGGSPASVYLYVDDVDAVYQRALDAGATADRPVQDQFYGDRTGCIKDPSGHSWALATHKEDLTPEEIDRRHKEFMKSMSAAAKS
jgi:PhnB protein